MLTDKADKGLHELRVGDAIADMHYGEAPIRARYDIVSHVRWEEPDAPHYHRAPHVRGDGYPEHAFFRYLEQFCRGGIYANKFLVVIGFTDNSTLSKPEVICGYCYDGRRSGLMVLREKDA